jgi:two-component system, NarL family, nitrate/nitrite response regulator NarL
MTITHDLPMKLLIVDDHSILREGLAEILRQSETGTEVLQARSIADGIAAAALNPDLDAILLDISFPDGSGLSAIGRFHAAGDTPIVILSSSEDPLIVRQALALGARGYVAKSASAQSLVAALRLVIAGEIYVPPFLSSIAEGAMTRGNLTQRQMEVLEGICGGLSNREIGFKLDMSEKTVKVHVTAIFRALNVVNRTQAVNAARATRLIAD